MDALLETTLRQQSSAASLPTTLEVTVLSPCIGQQTLTKINDSAYSGTDGPFTLVNLLAIDDGGSDSWALQIINFDQTPSGCFGVTNYRLDTPSDDPVGEYCKWNGSSKDCSAGRAVVS